MAATSTTNSKVIFSHHASLPLPFLPRLQANSSGKNWPTIDGGHGFNVIRSIGTTRSTSGQRDVQKKMQNCVETHRSRLISCETPFI